MNSLPTLAHESKIIRENIFTLTRFFQLFVMAAYTSIAAVISPASLHSQIYLPDVNVPAAGIRLYAPWLFISATVRLFTFLHYGDRGWYDATMVTLTAAVLHWSSEYFVHGTIGPQMFVTSLGFDLTGLFWMALAREAATGGGF